MIVLAEVYVDNAAAFTVVEEELPELAAGSLEDVAGRLEDEDKVVTVCPKPFRMKWPISFAVDVVDEVEDRDEE